MNITDLADDILGLIELEVKNILSSVLKISKKKNK